MSLQRVFLSAFILAFAAAALLAIGVILFSTWGQLEGQLLMTTISIGGYSLIALGCSTVYPDARWRAVAIAGLFACGIGLAFALLTNWEVIKPGFEFLLKGRLAFLTAAMALAASALMLRIEPTGPVVRFSRGATIFLICLTALLFEYILFFVKTNDREIFKLMAACSILALLGLVATPILRRIYA